MARSRMHQEKARVITEKDKKAKQLSANEKEKQEKEQSAT